MTVDIAVKNLEYSYPSPRGEQGEVVSVLRGVDVEIQSGEFVALLGRVGAGKTTLCMALNGLVPHATGGVFRGIVQVLGEDTRHRPVSDLARSVGIVFQDAESQLVHMRVEDEVAFGPENLGVPREEIEERVTWALASVGLAEYRARSPLHLSGGEKQRVAIASMLAMRPKVLVLDEPTASLDPAGKAAVFAVLGDLARDHKITIVMATQEMERIARFADRVLILHNGRIALNDEPAQVFKQVAQLQEWGLNVPQVAELGHMLNQRTGESYEFGSLSDAYKQLRRRARAINMQKSRLAPQPVATPIKPLGEKAQVEVNHISYRYADGTSALLDVDFSLHPGEFVALIGPNGAGKTTLAKHLNGLLKPTSGSVCVERLDTRSTSTAELARYVGYVFQNPDHQIFAPTVEEEIAFGPKMQNLPQNITARRVADVLDRFHLTPTKTSPRQPWDSANAVR